MTVLDHVLKTLLAWKYNATSEAELQIAVAAAFTKSAVPYREQVILSTHDVVDFTVPWFGLLTDAGRGDIGVELKTRGSLSAVTRQLFRYAECTWIAGLVLVSTKSAHGRVPRVINGKPVGIVCLRTGLE